ncbi:MAG: T9SS type A sorting domain-containing protein [Bacteroidia bacterium]|nr:T9SS type A sorting domain-containing protein [Bacteroidia bacterium]MDW8235224.1 T9SS type A sorting domain-containing protein [Bacteroidia bacterium]
MRYAWIILSVLLVPSLVRAQCNECTPRADRSPRPFGFNPQVVCLPTNKDTSFVVYFSFPDSSRSGGTLIYPNYAVWVDSLRLVLGLFTNRDGSPFAYNSSNPAQGGIRFHQMHRRKQYSSNAADQANFVVYQNPGGAPGATPPIGCAQICVKTGATSGQDTLRVKVRAFVPNPLAGDAPNKDTTNLAPIFAGTRSYLDTFFNYIIFVGVNPPDPGLCAMREFSASLARAPESIRHFTLAPNPAIGETQAFFSVTMPGKLTLRVVNAAGQEVYVYTNEFPVGEHTHALRLPAGFYMVFIEDRQGALMQRLVIAE